MREYQKLQRLRSIPMVDASRQPAVDSILAEAQIELSALFGDRLGLSRAIREQHANTTTWVAATLPDAVAFPRSTDEVQQAVRICARYRVPTIAFGTGTSFEGHVNAPFGGLCLDLREMNRVIE